MGPLRLYFGENARSRRHAELIGILWILSLADLGFTLWAHFFTPFHEVNPLARLFLAHNLIPGLILFKLVVTTIGAQIFWRLRQHRRAETALWGIVIVYVFLTIRWSSYATSALAMSGSWGGSFQG